MFYNSEEKQIDIDVCNGRKFHVLRAICKNIGPDVVRFIHIEEQKEGCKINYLTSPVPLEVAMVNVEGNAKLLEAGEKNYRDTLTGLICLRECLYGTVGGIVIGTDDGNKHLLTCMHNCLAESKDGTYDFEDKHFWVTFKTGRNCQETVFKISHTCKGILGIHPGKLDDLFSYKIDAALVKVEFNKEKLDPQQHHFLDCKTKIHQFKSYRERTATASHKVRVKKTGVTTATTYGLLHDNEVSLAILDEEDYPKEHYMALCIESEDPEKDFVKPGDSGALIEKVNGPNDTEREVFGLIFSSWTSEDHTGDHTKRGKLINNAHGTRLDLCLLYLQKKTNKILQLCRCRLPFKFLYL